jgi:dTDP-4-amino-4,6-dideoxygalactose transaminase
VIGWNARMDGIQGAILSVKLKYLDAANEARQSHARLYVELLADTAAITLPYEAPYARHVYHLFAIRAKQREELIRRLASRDIACGIHYPVPLHLQEAYASLEIPRGTLPIAELSSQECLSLPMFPELTPEQIAYVCDELKTAVNTT